MTISREEFEQLKAAVEQHAAELKVQFERIAQMQAELDRLRIGSERRTSRKKSLPLPTALAADEGQP